MSTPEEIREILKRHGYGSSQQEPPSPSFNQEQIREILAKHGYTPQKPSLWKQVGEGVKETPGFLEAPYSIGSGMGYFPIALGAATGKVLDDFWKSSWIDVGGEKYPPPNIFAGLGNLLARVWRSGGRENVVDVDFEEAGDLMDKIMMWGTYQPKTELGQTLTEVGASPFQAIDFTLNKAIEQVTKDPQTQSALRIAGYWALMKLVPKATGKFRNYVNRKMRGGEVIYARDLKAMLPEVEELPGSLRKTIDRLPDDLKLTVDKKAIMEVERAYEWMEKESVEMRGSRFKGALREAKRQVADVSGNVKRRLLKKLGQRGKEAVIHHDLVRGASAKAEKWYGDATDKIYAGLTKDEALLLDRTIASRREVAIGEYKPDFKHFKKTKTEQHAEYVRAIPDWIHERADMYFNEMKKALDVLKDEGLIDEEGYQRLIQHEYSPRQVLKYIDPERSYNFGGQKITVHDSGLRGLEEGSFSAIETDSRLLLGQVINRTTSRVFRNRANKALYELAKENPENGVVKLAKIISEEKPLTKEQLLLEEITGETQEAGTRLKYQKTPAGHEAVYAVIDGQPRKMLMPWKYAQEWVESDPASRRVLTEFLRWSSGSWLLKPMATGINPEFALTNFPRDIMHIWITTDDYSSFGPKFIGQMGADLATVAGDAFLRKGRWLDYLDEGGGMNFLTHQGQMGRKLPFIGDLQEVLGYIGETSEIWTRLALRERALRNGKAPHEATWTARNYLDFSQGGSLIKAIDSGCPYLNAGVQATRGIFRAFGDRPWQTSWKFAQMATIATGIHLANKYINPGCYEAVPDRDKVGNLIVTTPLFWKDQQGNKRHLYFKIAIDQGQRIVKTLAENMADLALGEKVDGEQVAQALGDFLPVVPTNIVPPSLDAILGYMANVDTWKMEPVWKGPEVEPGKEKTLYTHPALAEIGEKTGLSPERLNHVLKQFFTYGNIYTSLVGGGLKTLFDSVPEEEREKTVGEFLTRLPFIRRLAKSTNPYEPHKKTVEEIRLKENTRRYEQNLQIDKLAEQYYLIKTQRGVEPTGVLRQKNGFIRSQPPEDMIRLDERFRHGVMLYGIPDRRWWQNIHSLTPEARAQAYFSKWLVSDRDKKDEMDRLLFQLPGMASSRFLIRLGKLKQKLGLTQ